MPAILKVSGARKLSVCLLISILIHACLSVTVTLTVVIVRKVVILLWYAIQYYTWNLLWIVCIIKEIEHPCCCHLCKETVKSRSNTPLLIDCFILTSQVISIDWSTHLVDGSTVRRTIRLLHKYGFMCSCPPMRRTVNWLQYVETLSPTPLPDSSL